MPVAVSVCDPSVMITGLGDSTAGWVGAFIEDKARVLPPSTTPAEPRLTVDPEIVTTGPPSLSVWVPTINTPLEVATAVCDEPPKVITTPVCATVVAAGKAKLLLPTATEPPCRTVTGVLSSVIAGSPAERVESPITTAPV